MKKMVFSILMLGLVGLAAGQTIHDANAQKRDVSGFHGVSVSGNIELFVTQGGEESVAISADDADVRDRVITEVKDGILKIYLQRRHSKIDIDWKNGFRKIRAYVSVKEIDYLGASGSGKTHIEGTVHADKLNISVSGSGNMDGNVVTKELTLGLSGSANADISGSAEHSTFGISGSGNIRSYDFSTDYCNASISGSGNVRVTVRKELSAHISGSGNVLIKGDGMIRDYTASGSGKFKRVN